MGIVTEMDRKNWLFAGIRFSSFMSMQKTFRYTIGLILLGIILLRDI